MIVYHYTLLAVDLLGEKYWGSGTALTWPDFASSQNLIKVFFE